jgi:hypothetical protein
MNQEIQQPLMNDNLRQSPYQTDDRGTMISYQNMAIVVLVGLLVLSFLGINILLVVGNFFQTIINLFGPLVYQILGVFGYTAGAVINKTADIAGDTAKVGVDVAEGTVQSVGNLLLKSSGVVVDPYAKAQLDKTMNTQIRIPLPKETVYVPVPVPSPGTSKSLDTFLNNPVTRFFGYTTPGPTTKPPLTVAPLTASPLTVAPLTVAPLTVAPLTPAANLIPSSDSASSKIQAPITANKTSWCLVGEENGRRTCLDVQDQTKCLSGQIYPSQQDCLSIQPDNTNLSINKMNSNVIVPSMNSNMISYGNGTMMMNGLPMPPLSMQQPLTTQPPVSSDPSPLQLPQMIGSGPLPPQKNSGFPNILTPLPVSGKFITPPPPQTKPGYNAPLPYKASIPSPASSDLNVIQADGPPIGNGNGPVNYFYTYGTRDVMSN